MNNQDIKQPTVQALYWLNPEYNTLRNSVHIQEFWYIDTCIRFSIHYNYPLIYIKIR
jgi:hypothetical protein